MNSFVNENADLVQRAQTSTRWRQRFSWRPNLLSWLRDLWPLSPWDVPQLVEGFPVWGGHMHIMYLFSIYYETRCDCLPCFSQKNVCKKITTWKWKCTMNKVVSSYVPPHHVHVNTGCSVSGCLRGHTWITARKRFIRTRQVSGAPWLAGSSHLGGLTCRRAPPPCFRLMDRVCC